MDNRVVVTDYDSFLFHQGTNYEIYRKLGAHPGEAEGVQGTWFNVWAPNAQFVSVITAKTGWENEKWMHRSEGDSGVWECFLADVGPGDAYRYVVTGADGVKRYKSFLSLGVILIGCAGFLIFFMIMYFAVRAKYKFHEKPSTNNYLEGGALNFGVMQDVFVSEHTSRTAISSGSGGSGGGGGSHSGGGSHY